MPTIRRSKYTINLAWKSRQPTGSTIVVVVVVGGGGEGIIIRTRAGGGFFSSEKSFGESRRKTELMGHTGLASRRLRRR
jgi:hypothetical protein